MHTYTHTVQYYETDKMGITHHSNYIRFMEEARIDFLQCIGWGYDKMEEEGILSPVTSVNCNYKKTTTFADKLVISVNVTEVTRVKLVISYTMSCRDEIVCTAESTHCFLSKDGRLVSISKQYPAFYDLLHSLAVRQP